MQDCPRKRLYFVDDEEHIREAIESILKNEGYEVQAFSSGDKCLEHLRINECDMLITDVRLPGTDGLELLQEAKRIYPKLPVMLVTGMGDVSTAVRAMKLGAYDFIEKPIQRVDFLSKIQKGLSVSDSVVPPVLAGLTKMETIILKLILEGKTNRQIAEQLHRSIRTIEAHRKGINKKYGVNKATQLIQIIFNHPEAQ